MGIKKKMLNMNQPQSIEFDEIRSTFENKYVMMPNYLSSASELEKGAKQQRPSSKETEVKKEVMNISQSQDKEDDKTLATFQTVHNDLSSSSELEKGIKSHDSESINLEMSKKVAEDGQSQDSEGKRLASFPKASSKRRIKADKKNRKRGKKRP